MIKNLRYTDPIGRIRNLPFLHPNDTVRRIGTVVPAAIDSIRRIHSGSRPGLPTGFPDLDELTDGLHAGELVVIAGHPGMGKTSFVLSLVRNLAIENEPPIACAIFCPEMTSGEVVYRLIGSVAKVQDPVLRGGFLSDNRLSEVIGVAGEIADAPIWLDDAPEFSIGRVRRTARRLKRRCDVRLIVIDGLPYDGTSESAAPLKELAVELGVTVILVVRLPRDRDDLSRHPDFEDLPRIERFADVIGFLAREECYADEDRVEFCHGEAELVIAKQGNGATGVVPLIFEKAFRRFESHPGSKRSSPVG